MDLPSPDTLFPDRSTAAIVRFWIGYWFWFFALLPWMLLRQVAITLVCWWRAWHTTGKTWRFLDGQLEIGFVGSFELVITSGMFGERFTWLRWRDVVIDPGPARTRAVVLTGLRASGNSIHAVVCTHFHEEHIGNAAAVAQAFQVPVLASDLTRELLRQPPVLPEGRYLMMGQAEPAGTVALEPADGWIRTALAEMQVVPSPGHCRGHLSLFVPGPGILFAGDSFLHEVFTSPNGDSDSASWITTLEAFATLPVRTLVGAHGEIITSDSAIPVIPGVVRRGDPARLIADKLAFLRWSAAVVGEGERRSLPHSVIEACLFPWQRAWSWRTWFHDEGFRLLTCGEFSRTHYVRSLAQNPAAVPARFPAFRRLGERLARLGPELLRIHVLATRPEPVLVIAGSILWSIAVLVAAAWASGLPPTDPLHLLIQAGPWLIQDLSPMLIESKSQGLGWSPTVGLAVVLVAWIGWWSWVGGAITRRMALAVIGAPAESWRASLAWCRRPALLLPSLLASGCLLAIALLPWSPWTALPVLPVWLVAGFLYGALCLDPATLSDAFRTIGRVLRRPGPVFQGQVESLLGFAASTGVIYLIVGAWWGLGALVMGSWSNVWVLAWAAPALIYALGYTTANLKSLQLRLFVRFFTSWPPNRTRTSMT